LRQHRECAAAQQLVQAAAACIAEARNFVTRQYVEARRRRDARAERRAFVRGIHAVVNP
jgi:hypothetical protein